MDGMNRRSFLTSAAAGATALAAGGRVRAGIIGAGGRGRYLTEQFKEIGAEMAAVCDVYETNLQAGLKVASTGARPYDNYKKLLEDKSLDAVVIATPDHWHAQMTIDAVDAGKDVYVEKPMAHTIEEGFRMIDAVKRTRRIVQVGTQRRSFPLFLEAKAIMESGRLGPVKLVNSWWLDSTPKALSKPTLQGKVDWQQWLGSAPKVAFDPVRFRNWYWFWDYSGGLLIGQAAHVLDAIHWFMNAAPPLSVSCMGKLDMAGAQVPETASMTLEYPDFLAVFTLGYKAMKYAYVNDQMKQFHGTQARFDVARESYALYPADPKAIDMKATDQKREPGTFGSAARSHIRNFLDCVQSRKEPNAPVEKAQITNIALAMAMESLKNGRRVHYDAARRRMA
jgi:predicted dehydrogenase